ncbi:MAG: electron transport complex subunit RsxB [Rhodospirillaceae bacterium]|nr:electron transport complex subunit RsxB [Rhodospirillaceae bacterium]|tara:strand:+ start:6418 stop:6915 length:498 start_codon:yes stop_codon:yes gene_type:complete
MATATLILSGIAITLAILLMLAARYFSSSTNEVVEKIETLLPRIQCAQCGYPGCRPYAKAIAEENAEINLCPPGGDETVRRLANFLGREFSPVTEPVKAANLNTVALISEELCIGCNLCSQACPVDAIVGVHQRMHTVISEHCTGCRLCVSPCPVDCISLIPRHG